MLAALAGALLLLLGVALIRGRGDRVARKSAAELAAGNFRTLTPAESRRLVRYARREYRCFVAHGAHVSAPVVSRTRITIAAPRQPVRLLVRLQETCDPAVGPPPPRASLQARNGRVLVYVPKRCLLDPKVAADTA